MTYRLIALPDDAPSRTVGDYPDFETALLGRIEDVVDQLRANHGWWLRADHLIVGPGPDGPQTHYPLCTGLGVDPASDKVPAETDLAEARRWLMFAHDLTLPEILPQAALVSDRSGPSPDEHRSAGPFPTPAHGAS
jgi:hypothetical protein